MYNYIRLYGTSEQKKAEEEERDGGESPKKKKKERAGILEGLRLFWEHNYVKGKWDLFATMLAISFPSSIHSHQNFSILQVSLLSVVCLW